MVHNILCALLLGASIAQSAPFFRYMPETEGFEPPTPSASDPLSAPTTTISNSPSFEDGKASYGTGAPDPNSFPRENPSFPGAPAPSEPYGAAFGGDPAISKRGIATYASGWNDKYDYFTKMGNLHWYYDWYEQQPSDRIRDWTRKSGMDFVAQFSKAGQVNSNPDGYSKALIGFNEPNIRSQSSIPPQDAANPWKTVMATAAKRQLRLGSPSASQCAYYAGERDCITRSPFPWFDQWQAACKKNGFDCTFDVTALHFYSCNAEYLVAYVTEFYKKFGKPIWITEMGCCLKDTGLNSTEEERQQIKFARKAFKALDALPFVERYAWFEVSVDGWPCLGSSNNLFDGNKQLTNLGKVFTNTPITEKDLAKLPSGIATALTDPVPEVKPGGTWWELCGDCDDSDTFRKTFEALKPNNTAWRAFVLKCRDCGYNDKWNNDPYF